MSCKDANCRTCYYSYKDVNENPCMGCFQHDKWIPVNIYKEDSIMDMLSSQSQKYDVVNKPKHYMLFEDKGIEVRDVITKLLDKLYDSHVVDAGPIVFSDYAQAMQYVMRFMDKGGVEDIEKAVWYFNKIIENLKK